MMHDTNLLLTPQIDYRVLSRLINRWTLLIVYIARMSLSNSILIRNNMNTLCLPKEIETHINCVLVKRSVNQTDRNVLWVLFKYFGSLLCPLQSRQYGPRRHKQHWASYLQTTLHWFEENSTEFLACSTGRFSNGLFVVQAKQYTHRLLVSTWR